MLCALRYIILTNPFWKGAVVNPHGIGKDLEEHRGKMIFPGTHVLSVVKPKFEIDSLPVVP